MDFIQRLFDFVLHLDKHLSALIQSYGLWTYLILFFVIFLETGFVVTPFLPGITAVCRGTLPSRP